MDQGYVIKIAVICKTSSSFVADYSLFRGVQDLNVSLISLRSHASTRYS